MPSEINRMAFYFSLYPGDDEKVSHIRILKCPFSLSFFLTGDYFL
jgi:hypothetical protein